MLTENDVISAVCRYLQNKQFEIKQALHTSEKGIDIIAKNNNFTLFIEAKGATSALKTSSRYGKPFNKNQIKSHVGQALLAVMKIATEHNDKEKVNVGIALPDNEGHRELISEIWFAVEKLGIYIFWVKDSNKVESTLEWSK
ncbi:hypothetical protein CD30_13065 [Ureibacillus massiliensis 4400831 = CIP 108448 = CCUG 49529]|uniref:Uncharacterized protein n=1 Tax=Ureibacillus massiliensis 4400831 = CIP 108448 = CCUG 49529 TaxID=1211035 RepID=A0A0A3J3A0_9BACL|nr:hypothetical protein [Ureibacillus massiliensis]KGR90175.1 hypothetical protein CD30_13065 [Ureibacillus massiliensis 4400831 = CIP 108448 = CCUG 49529]